MEFEGVRELEIVKEGNSLFLRPARPSWISLVDYEAADDDFLQNREDIIEEDGRIAL
jgi:antitoxin VapB